VEGQAGRVTACSELQAMGAGRRCQHWWPDLVILQLPVALSLSLHARVFLIINENLWIVVDVSIPAFCGGNQNFRNEKIDSFVPNAYDIIKTQEDDPLKFLCPIPRSRRGVCACPC
jgi:hypothetical protein